MTDRIVMRPLGDDPPQARLIYGQDCLASLKTLPDQSVHMVATSPPYFGLRDYGTATWEGGADPACDHDVTHWDGPKQTQGAQSGHASKADRLARSLCTKCGAHRVDNQIGLEDTPERYIERLVEVFQEVRRVLRDDGVAWLNLGDSYVTPMKGIGGDTGFSAGGDKRQNNRTQPKMDQPIKASYGNLPVKSKDILGIPWRVAFALQADGWWLRQDIVWAKGNPMPESVTDRCTRSHEYIFLLTKRERYFFDAAAIREDSAGYTRKGGSAPYTADGSPTNGIGSATLHQMSGGGRNKRSVWAVNPKPYAGAHFAVWPEALVEPMILAGTSQQGCCPACGSPWGRVGPSQPLGWQPTCQCGNPATVRCTVLDPFSGSATTGDVALRLGRHYIGLDLNPAYLDLAVARLQGRVAPDRDQRTPPDVAGWDPFYD